MGYKWKKLNRFPELCCERDQISSPFSSHSQGERWPSTPGLRGSICCCLEQGYLFSSFPGGSDDKESACKAGDPDPVFLPAESHGQRSLAGCSPWGHKESDTPERLLLSTVEMYLWSAYCYWSGEMLPGGGDP